MLTASPRRLWALIGVAGTIVIVALGWLLLINGEKSEQSQLESDTANAQQQAATQRNKIAALARDNKQLPVHKAHLADLQRALPNAPSSAEFNRELQALSNQTSVKITSLSITPPVLTVPAPAATGSTDGTGGAASASPSAATPPGTAAGVIELPVTLSAEGSTANLEKFVTLLQTGGSRALLVEKVTEVSSADEGGKNAVKPTLSVSMKAFFSVS